MAQAYAEAALFTCPVSRSDDEKDDLENASDVYNTSDFAPETLAAFSTECAQFVTDNADLLAELGDAIDIDWAQLGHSLWFSAHGLEGFGSGDWPDPFDDRLDAAVDSGHECGYLYVGDDGKLYSD